MNNGLMANRWPAVIFFLTSGLFFFGCVWYLWAGNFEPPGSAETAVARSVAVRPATADVDGPILLIKDRDTIVGDTRVIYRGRENGTVHLDLFILSLDPHFAYPHRIDETSAQDGFQMGEHRFRLLASGRQSIRLLRM